MPKSIGQILFNIHCGAERVRKKWENRREERKRERKRSEQRRGEERHHVDSYGTLLVLLHPRLQ